MNELIEYKKFSDKIDAEELILILKQNNIQYEVLEPVMKFRLVDNPEDAYVTIKIQAADIERVNKLQEAKDNEEIEKNTDHFLYTFSDNDIIDVIVNPLDWKTLEVKIAKKIAKDRDLKPTADQVKKIRNANNSEKQSLKSNEQKSIVFGASWILWVGVLSIVNLIAFTLNQDIHFIFGLNINYVFIGISQGIQDSLNIDTTFISLILGVLISGLFILLGIKSKKRNKKAFLFGLVLYGIDSILSIFVKDWISLGFHLFALLFILTGYLALISNLREKQTLSNKS